MNDSGEGPSAPKHSEPLLRVQDVVKTYGSRRALDHVTLTVAAGEFVALLGANGAGKSTLIQLLTGLFTPDEGKIVVLEHDMRTNAVAALAGIGVVFQQQTLDLELSVSANLFFHADLHGISRSAARPRIAAALEHYGLSDRARERIRALSGGNRRRAELARALLHQPSLLLMDEATAGLDPGSRRDILEEMVRLKTAENIGILWATHLVDEIELADRFIVLRRGRIIFNGTPGELKKKEADDDLAAIVIRLMETEERDAAALPPAA
jgi:ABC-2 type transport system ATP-binding protein